MGAGQADIIEKNLPTLAHIYDSMANSLSSRGHGGGGGGGGGGASHFIQVLPNPDGGSLAQVEQQANREQRAADFKLAYDDDPVAHHMQMRQEYAQRAQQQAMQQNQPAPQVTWTQADDEGINNATQAIATAQKELQASNIDQDTYQQLTQNPQNLLSALNEKKQAYQKQQAQQVFKQQSEADAMNRARNDVDARHLAQFGYRSVPDVIAPDYRFKANGDKYLANPEEYKASVQAKKDAQLYNHQIDLQRIKQEESIAKHKADMEVKAREVEQKAEENYLHHFKEVAKYVDKDEDEFMAGNGKVQPKATGGDGTIANRRRKNPQERAEAIGTHLEAMELPRSLSEFRAQRRGQRNQSGVQPQAAPNAPVVPMNTEKGQMEAFNAILGLHANAMPAPAPRKTLNPPGSEFSDQAKAEGSGFIFMP